MGGGGALVPGYALVPIGIQQCPGVPTYLPICRHPWTGWIMSDGAVSQLPFPRSRQHPNTVTDIGKLGSGLLVDYSTVLGAQVLPITNPGARGKLHHQSCSWRGGRGAEGGAKLPFLERRGRLVAPGLWRDLPVIQPAPGASEVLKPGADPNHYLCFVICKEGLPQPVSCRLRL